jgi:hypothetical protein
MRYIAVFISAIALFFSVPAFSAPSNGFQVGLELGSWMSGGDVSVDDDGSKTYIDLQKESNFMFRGYLDAYVTPIFQPGIFFNYVPSVTYENATVEQRMFEFGFAFKFKIAFNDQACLRPGFGIGSRTFSSDTKSADGMKGLGLDLSIEFQYEFSKSAAFLIETGFLSQPVGGNSDYTMQFPPIWYLTAGIAF